MAEDLLSERKRALEEEYFRNANAALVEQLRAARQREDARLALQHASGIQDEAVIDSLIDAGIDASALSALEVVPLVAAAWADGKLEDDERRAVLDGAASLGLTEGTEGYALLEDWLAQQPPTSLLRTWEDYVRGLARSLSPDVLARLREETMKRARAAAEARGGFLGVGSRISPKEQAVLDLIERSFAS